MRLFVTPDLHGAKPKVYSEFDRVLCIGDYRSSPQRPYIFKALDIRDETGEYPDWEELAGKWKAKRLYKKSQKDGIKLLKFLKKLSGKEDLILIPGNWDNTKEEVTYWYEDYSVNNIGISHEDLIKKLGGIKDIHKKRIEFKDCIMIGWGISNNPEFYTKKLKKYKNYSRAKKKYDKVFERVAKHFIYAKKKKKPVIFFTHNVPYNTKLDKITDKESPGYGRHLGSLMARRLIEKYQPKICLGGHMHEHFGFDKIKKTLCVNVGYGSEKNTYLDISEKQIKVELWEKGKIKKKRNIKL